MRIDARIFILEDLLLVDSGRPSFRNASPLTRKGPTS